MLIEAAKGGHTNVVSYLLDYPNNILSVPAPDLSQLTPPSQDASQVNTWVGKNQLCPNYVICKSVTNVEIWLHKPIVSFVRFLVSHSKL